MIDAQSLEDKDRLAPYALLLLDGLLPVLGRLDHAKLDPRSVLELTEERNGLALHLLVQPADPLVSFLFLDLFASSGQCILGFAESEQVECHGDPDADAGLVGMVLEATTRYLSGVTVLQHYNRKGRLLRREYFFGIDGDGQSAQKIGASSLLLVWPRKVAETKKASYRFLVP